MKNDTLSAQEILSYLPSELGELSVSVFTEIESTNKTAKEMAASGAKHGTVVIADCQTAGRGRYGRRFYSPPSYGLYISLILKPSFLSFESLTLVTVFTAVAVCEALERLTMKEPSIKWVNDLFLDGRKICGILAESVTNIESRTIESIVAGIGINLSVPSEAFPEEIRDIAGSIYPDGKPPISRNHLAAEIIHSILSNTYSQHHIIEAYKHRLNMLGKKVCVVDGAGGYEGMAKDVDEQGQLILLTADGDIHTLSSGEISIRTL